jgi:hypothetical protein
MGNFYYYSQTNNVALQSMEIPLTSAYVYERIEKQQCEWKYIVSKTKRMYFIQVLSSYEGRDSDHQ